MHDTNQHRARRLDGEAGRHRISEPSAAARPDRGRQRWRRRLATAGALAVLPGVALAPDPTAASSHAPAGDPDGSIVWEWNEVAMSALTASGRPLLTQPFVVTAMHVAMYDAVVAIEGYSEPFLAALPAPEGASAQAAAAVAAHDVLVGFVPSAAATFDAALVTSLASIPDGPAEDDGAAVGHAAAASTLAARLDDGTQQGPLPPALEPGPGVWSPAPPATTGLTPWLASAEPYTMKRPDQFRPPAPPRLESREFRLALDEVRRLGAANSTERSAEQTTIARFWGDQPIAQNQRTLRRQAQRLDWGLAATARLFAAVMTSEADALIACWDAKYHYQFWRPWQSVPTVEPGWTPLLATPNHPEFPSAHGCLTGSMGLTMAAVMGTPSIELDVDAANIGVTRHYSTVDELLAEVGDARILGGLHYRFSVEAGLRIAQRVVTLNMARNFRLA